MKLWLAPNGLHVEMGELSDAKLLAKIHESAFYQGWPETDFVAFLSEQQRTPIYICCDKKRNIKGFASIRHAGDEAELLSIVVVKKNRTKGVGTAILRAIIDDLLLSPVEKFFLEVDENNPAAIKLYKNFGFLEVGKRKGYYKSDGDEKSTALVMALKLD